MSTPKYQPEWLAHALANAMKLARQKGASVKEIAEKTGLPPSSVSSMTLHGPYAHRVRRGAKSVPQGNSTGQESVNL